MYPNSSSLEKILTREIHMFRVDEFRCRRFRRIDRCQCRGDAERRTKLHDRLSGLNCVDTFVIFEQLFKLQDDSILVTDDLIECFDMQITVCIQRF